MKLSGPFQSTGDGKLPKLDLQASFEGEGESVSGGVTSTGDQAFVGWAGDPVRDRRAGVRAVQGGL